MTSHCVAVIDFWHRISEILPLSSDNDCSTICVAHHFVTSNCVELWILDNPKELIIKDFPVGTVYTVVATLGATAEAERDITLFILPT
jgi:hypothetical protein